LENSPAKLNACEAGAATTDKRTDPIMSALKTLTVLLAIWFSGVSLY
jgi:hypothetical protein